MDNQNNQAPSKAATILKVVCSLIMMAAIIIVLGIVALRWMDSFTMHGKVEVVPDVKDLPYNEAVERLLDAGLKVELSDSVYDSKSKPGVVLEQSPKGNTKVKPGRLVYITINAFSPKAVTLPQLTDVSVRQAKLVLEGLGITNVTVVPVMSEFKDLVLGVKLNGRRLLPGARVSVNSAITLEVGDGLPEMSNTPDTVAIDSAMSGEAADFERIDIN